MSKTVNIPKESKQETKQGAAIMLAVNLESAFKLYSYRILTPEQFTERTEELIAFYKSKT